MVAIANPNLLSPEFSSDETRRMTEMALGKATIFLTSHQNEAAIVDEQNYQTTHEHIDPVFNNVHGFLGTKPPGTNGDRKMDELHPGPTWAGGEFSLVTQNAVNRENPGNPKPFIVTDTLVKKSGGNQRRIVRASRVL